MKIGDAELGRRDMLRAMALLALVAGALVLCLGTPEVETGDAAGVVMSLPERVGAFQGEEVPMSEPERTLLPPGTELVRRRYGKGESHRVMCTIVLSSADRRSIHRPEICLPGQGWSTDARRVVELELADGNRIPAMLMEISHAFPGPGGAPAGRVRGKFAYWFVGRDVVTPYHGVRLFRTAWDRIVRGVAHRWAYVSMMGIESPQSQAEGSGGVEEDIRQLARELGPKVLMARRP